MAPAPVQVAAAPQLSQTNVVIVAKIPEGVTEQQVAGGCGRYTDVLQLSYWPADEDGLGWAIIACASPEIAKATRDKLDGKPLQGAMGPFSKQPIQADLGEGLYGNVRNGDMDSPWKEARTMQGQVYYYHNVTREAVWVKPPPEFSAPAAQTTAIVATQKKSVSQPAPPPSAGAQPAIQAAQAVAATAQAQAAPAAAPVNLNSGPVGANLFIYHIPNSWDDGILKQHFEHFGKIISCRVQVDAEGRPRGFGFVSFDAPGSAQAAIAGMHGFPVEGKHLKVQLKKGDEQAMTPGACGAPAPVAGNLLDMGGHAPPPGGGCHVPPPPLGAGGAPTPPWASMRSGAPPRSGPYY